MEHSLPPALSHAYREKRVIQYPPGTGFALSIFPAGFQRLSLYALANVITLLAALIAVVWGYLTNFLADAPNERRRLLATAGVGFLLGLAVSVRLPKLFLSAGYFIVLLALAFKAGDFKRLIQTVKRYRRASLYAAALPAAFLNHHLLQPPSSQW